MIALILIPLALAFAFSGILDAEIDRIVEENGLDGFDPKWDVPAASPSRLGLA